MITGTTFDFQLDPEEIVVENPLWMEYYGQCIVGSTPLTWKRHLPVDVVDPPMDRVVTWRRKVKKLIKEDKRRTRRYSSGSSASSSSSSASSPERSCSPALTDCSSLSNFAADYLNFPPSPKKNTMRRPRRDSGSDSNNSDSSSRSSSSSSSSSSSYASGVRGGGRGGGRQERGRMQGHQPHSFGDRGRRGGGAHSFREQHGGGGASGRGRGRRDNFRAGGGGSGYASWRNQHQTPHGPRDENNRFNRPRPGTGGRTPFAMHIRGGPNRDSPPPRNRRMDNRGPPSGPMDRQNGGMRPQEHNGRFGGNPDRRRPFSRSESSSSSGSGSSDSGSQERASRPPMGRQPSSSPPRGRNMRSPGGPRHRESRSPFARDTARVHSTSPVSPSAGNERHTLPPLLAGSVNPTAHNSRRPDHKKGHLPPSTDRPGVRMTLVTRPKPSQSTLNDVKHTRRHLNRDESPHAESQSGGGGGGGHRYHLSGVKRPYMPPSKTGGASGGAMPDREPHGAGDERGGSAHPFRGGSRHAQERRQGPPTHRRPRQPSPHEHAPRRRYSSGSSGSSSSFSESDFRRQRERNEQRDRRGRMEPLRRNLSRSPNNSPPAARRRRRQSSSDSPRPSHSNRPAPRPPLNRERSPFDRGQENNVAAENRLRQLRQRLTVVNDAIAEITSNK